MKSLELGLKAKKNAVSRAKIAAMINSLNEHLPKTLWTIRKHYCQFKGWSLKFFVCSAMKRILLIAYWAALLSYGIWLHMINQVQWSTDWHMSSWSKNPQPFWICGDTWNFQTVLWAAPRNGWSEKTGSHKMAVTGGVPCQKQWTLRAFVPALSPPPLSQTQRIHKHRRPQSERNSHRLKQGKPKHAEI